MSTMRVVVNPVRTRRDRADFVALPWRIYAGDPCWVAPFRAAVRHKVSRRTNPVRAHLTVEHFVARSETGEPLGRIAATIDPGYVRRHAPHAFFGWFECVPDRAVAAGLLDTVEQWAAERCMTGVVGPCSYTTTQDLGLRLTGRPEAVFLRPYNPTYYADLLRAHGYLQMAQMATYSWTTAKHGHLAEGLLAEGQRVMNDHGLRSRMLDLQRYDDEIEVVRLLYNRSFAMHPHHVPIDRTAFRAQAGELKPIVDPNILRIVERSDGRVVAFVLMIPNLNESLTDFNGRVTPSFILGIGRRLRRIRAAVVLMMGVEPTAVGCGLGRALTAEIVRATVGGRYDTVHTTWIHEDNHACRAVVNHLGTEPEEEYGLFQRSFA